MTRNAYDRPGWPFTDDDAALLKRVANLLYPAGDHRAGPWPSPEALGKLRHDLRTLADVFYRDVPWTADDDHPRVIALVPAEGWRAEWKGTDGSVIIDQPLVGWGLRSDGTVVAIDTDTAGMVEEISERHVGCRIYHPDSGTGR